jgi:hypothetical protein
MRLDDPPIPMADEIPTPPEGDTTAWIYDVVITGFR